MITVEKPIKDNTCKSTEAPLVGKGGVVPAPSIGKEDSSDGGPKLFKGGKILVHVRDNEVVDREQDNNS